MEDIKLPFDLSLSDSSNHSEQVSTASIIMQNPLLLSKPELELKLRSELEINHFTFSSRDKNKSPGWLNFEEIHYKGQKQVYVKCRLCGGLLAYRNKTGTAGILRHRCEGGSAGGSTGRGQGRAARPRSSERSTKSCLQQPLNSSAAAISVSTALAEAQMEYILRDLVSPYCMDGPGFRRLAQTLTYLGSQPGRTSLDLSPGHTLVNCLIPNKIYEVKIHIGQLLAENSVSFSTEFWSTKDNVQYISLNGHTLSNNFRLKTFYLGSKILPHDYTNSQIELAMVDLIKEYVQDTENILTRSVIVTSIKDINISMSTVPCCATAIETLIDAVAQEDVSTPAVDTDTNSPPLNRIKRNGSPVLWASNHSPLNMNSNHSEDKITDARCEDAPTSPTETRDFFQLFRDCYANLTTADKTTVHEVYLWKKKLEKYLKSQQSDEPVLREMKERAGSALYKYFTMDTIHLLAVFLDPKFKALKFCTDDEKENILAFVKDAMKREEADCDEEPPPPKSPKLKNYFSEFMDSEEDSHGPTDPVAAELRRYLDWKASSSTDILQFWNADTRFPRLRSLAKKILHIPASCHGNIYSTEVKNFTERRRCLDMEDVDTILFLHQNFFLSAQ